MTILKLLIKYSKVYWEEIVLIILFIIAVSFMFNSCNQSKEIDRLESNYYAMCDSAKSYKTKSGYLAIQTKNQSLTIDELSAQYTNSKNMCKDLELKIKDLEQYQKGTVVVHHTDTISIHDTVLSNNVVAKTGHYSADCFSIDFIVDDSTAVFDAESNIPIDIFVSTQKEGKWWKFWTWPRKKVATTTAVSTCPNVSVTVNTCTVVN